MRISYEEDEGVEIQMSPLIDCVFLLLIFFLVTTMMKKWEKQIPLSLPSITSSLSTTQAGQNAVIIAVDEEEHVYQIINHDAYSGRSDFVPIADITGFLKDLRDRSGTEITINIAAYRTVPVQSVIDLFDKCQLEGFTHTSVRLGSKPYTATSRKD